MNPGTLREQLAGLYSHLGLEEPALREFQRAFEIDPTNEATQSRLVQAYAELGRYDDAVAAHQRFFNRPGPSLAYLRKNQLGEGQKTIERELARDPNDPMTLGRRALLLALQGKFQEAEAEIPVIMKRAQYDRAAHHYAYNIAAIYALQGQSQEAIVWLKKTVELGMPNYTLFARDTHLDQVRKEPAFIQFMNELKARREGYQREFR